MLAAQAFDDEVRALQRRILLLPTAARLELIRGVQELDPAAAGVEETVEQREALRILAAAAVELGLPGNRPPTARQFAASDGARAAGWTVARVRKTFGSWSAGCAAYTDRGGVRPVGPRHRAATRAANRHQARGRDSYLHALRLWLSTDPPSTTAADYSAWRAHYNATRAEGSPPVVSAVTLRNRLRRRWPDIVAIGRGTTTLADTQPRPDSRQPRLHGPHDLIGVAELRDLTGLGATALRTLTYQPRFPKPVYVRRQPPRTRLWRRADVRAYLDGNPVDGDPASVQDAYLDARQVADLLGLAATTVHSGIRGPRIPAPDVHVAGIKLWLHATIAT